MHVVGPGAAGLLDERAEDALVAGQCACVGGRRGRARRRGADLQHGDADAALGRARERGGEPRAVAVGLEEQRDRAELLLLDERREQRRSVEHRLVADRRDSVEADPPPDRERVDRHVAALGDQRHAPGRPRRQRVTPERGAVERDQTVAVGAQHRHRARRGGEVGLQRCRAHLGEAGREDDRGATADRGGRGDHARHGGGRNRDDDRVDRSGQILERRHAGPPVDLAPRRMHAPDRAVETERRQVAQRRVAVGARPIRGTDDGDGARVQQRGQVRRGHARHRARRRQDALGLRRQRKPAVVSDDHRSEHTCADRSQDTSCRAPSGHRPQASHVHRPGSRPPRWAPQSLASLRA